MEFEQPEGPFCQSCGMPMENEEVFGTNLDGSKNQEYCHYCFQNGEFTNADITMEEMSDLVAGFMAKEMKITENKAKEMAKNFIPQLKRWQG